MDVFEDTVFDSLDSGFQKKSHTAFSGKSSFEDRVAETMLSFDSLKKKDPRAIIKCHKAGKYEIQLSRQHLALSMKEIVAFDNSNIELMFSDDLMQFEPDEDLIIKSKVPLWVIKPMAGGSKVVIQRMW